jgi:hypothetical protein
MGHERKNKSIERRVLLMHPAWFLAIGDGIFWFIIIVFFVALFLKIKEVSYIKKQNETKKDDE